VQSSFHPADRMRAIGAWTGTLSIAAASGPVVGEWLLGYNWRWVFWVNVPPCVAVIIVAARYLPETQNPAASHTLDIPGVLLCALGLAGVTYPLIAWPGHELGALTIVSGIGRAPALAAFVVTESRARHPMLPTSMFASCIFSVINMVTLAVYAALSGAVLFLVLVLQVIAAGRHYRPAPRSCRRARSCSCSRAASAGWPSGSVPAR
jgi:MFS family permease